MAPLARKSAKKATKACLSKKKKKHRGKTSNKSNALRPVSTGKPRKPGRRRGRETRLNAKHPRYSHALKREFLPNDDLSVVPGIGEETKWILRQQGIGDVGTLLEYYAQMQPEQFDSWLREKCKDSRVPVKTILANIRSLSSHRKDTSQSTRCGENNSNNADPDYYPAFDSKDLYSVTHPYNFTQSFSNYGSYYADPNYYYGAELESWVPYSRFYTGGGWNSPNLNGSYVSTSNNSQGTMHDVENFGYTPRQNDYDDYQDMKYNSNSYTDKGKSQERQHTGNRDHWAVKRKPVKSILKRKSAYTKSSRPKRRSKDTSVSFGHLPRVMHPHREHYTSRKRGRCPVRTQWPKTVSRNNSSNHKILQYPCQYAGQMYSCSPDDTRERVLPHKVHDRLGEMLQEGVEDFDQGDGPFDATPEEVDDCSYQPMWANGNGECATAQPQYYSDFIAKLPGPRMVASEGGSYETNPATLPNEPTSEAKTKHRKKAQKRHGTFQLTGNHVPGSKLHIRYVSPKRATKRLPSNKRGKPGSMQRPKQRRPSCRDDEVLKPEASISLFKKSYCKFAPKQADNPKCGKTKNCVAKGKQDKTQQNIKKGQKRGHPPSEKTRWIKFIKCPQSCPNCSKLRETLGKADNLRGASRVSNRTEVKKEKERNLDLVKPEGVLLPRATLECISEEPGATPKAASSSKTTESCFGHDYDPSNELPKNEDTCDCSYSSCLLSDSCGDPNLGAVGEVLDFQVTKGKDNAHGEGKEQSDSSGSFSALLDAVGWYKKGQEGNDNGNAMATEHGLCMKEEDGKKRECHDGVEVCGRSENENFSQKNRNQSNSKKFCKIVGDDFEVVCPLVDDDGVEQQRAGEEGDESSESDDTKSDTDGNSDDLEKVQDASHDTMDGSISGTGECDDTKSRSDDPDGVNDASQDTIEGLIDDAAKCDDTKSRSETPPNDQERADDASQDTIEGSVEDGYDSDNESGDESDNSEPDENADKDGNAEEASDDTRTEEVG